MENFHSFHTDVTRALVATTRSASELAGEDLPFYRSLDSSLGLKVDQQNARLLALTERLLGVATANTEAVRPPSLRNLESVEGNWKAVVDVVDSLLERADTALDEFTGAVKRLSPGVEQTAKTAKTARTPRIVSALKELDIEKPQLHFEHVPTNRETLPFKPLLLSKPHASLPLETQPKPSDSDHPELFSHPYQSEIESYRYPSSLYTHSDPIPYHQFDTTTATFVDTEEAVEEMLAELKKAKEIAIDLEHHDARSFIGIVCLMQISTRDRDWIVDTLKPWRRKLECLNEVFANPGIVKVLHGAYMDITWLQRDLGLYVVGLFDTHHASRALSYAGGSLAFLLKKFANVDAQKQYQMADWRVRPLPRELFDYARSDTHYLLYIFDCMRNELIEQSKFGQADHEGDKLWDVLMRSSETALQRYEHPIYDSTLGLGSMGWYKLLSRTPALLNREQFAVFRGVHQWRDEVAREQDDSVNYVMPNHHIFNIAKTMPLTRSDLLSCIPGSTRTVRLRINELLAVIMRAKEDGAKGPDMMELLGRVDPKRVQRTPMTKPVETPAMQVHGAAATKATAPTSTLPLRSSASSLWGSAFTSSVWEQKRSLNTVALYAPLPPLASNGFDVPPEATQAKAATTPEAEPESITIDRVEEEDVFILKELSKKRKRDPLDAMAAQSDEVALPDDAVDDAKDKAERKQARRAAKKAAKAAAANGASDATSAEDSAPFDYASAPNLLAQPREDAKSAKERRKREKQLNPFAKALDAPKGLPRAQKEKAGKSMTFRT